MQAPPVGESFNRLGRNWNFALPISHDVDLNPRQDSLQAIGQELRRDRTMPPDSTFVNLLRRVRIQFPHSNRVFLAKENVIMRAADDMALVIAVFYVC